jgi:hypothetical protein
LRQYIEKKLGRLAANNAGIADVKISRKADQTKEISFRPCPLPV